MDVVDHGWAQSIYFKDPNSMQLKYACLAQDVGTEDDVQMQERFEVSVQQMGQRQYPPRQLLACISALGT